MAIIGGTGLTRLPDFTVVRRALVSTPYGNPSAELLIGRLHEQELIFLARHGDPHVLPPHRINYRANISALKQMGVASILAVAAVGASAPTWCPARSPFPIS